MTEGDHPFWLFSVAVYGRPGFHEACLDLQTQHSLDINLMLCCCFVAWSGGGRLSGAELEDLLNATEDWYNDVVEPVWRAQRRLKDGISGFDASKVADLRQSLVTAELVAERMAQDRLYELLDITSNSDREMSDRLSDAVANLITYLHRHGSGQISDSAFQTILGGCFSELPESQIKSTIAELQ